MIQISSTGIEICFHIVSFFKSHFSSPSSWKKMINCDATRVEMKSMLLTIANSGNKTFWYHQNKGSSSFCRLETLRFFFLLKSCLEKTLWHITLNGQFITVIHYWVPLKSTTACNYILSYRAKIIMIHSYWYKDRCRELYRKYVSDSFSKSIDFLILVTVSVDEPLQQKS